MTRTIRCPAGHTYGADNKVCPTCGAVGGPIEIVCKDEVSAEDALKGEGVDETGRQHFAVSVSILEQQSRKRTATGEDVSSVRLKPASRSELEARTCQSAINLIARELEQVFEYRKPTRDEDQAGADGFARLQRRGSKGARRPRELRLQVINSNKDAVAELGRHARFESQTTVRDLLDTTLEMIDLKFDKKHDLSNTVLLLRANTELPKGGCVRIDGCVDADTAKMPWRSIYSERRRSRRPAAARLYSGNGRTWLEIPGLACRVLAASPGEKLNPCQHYCKKNHG